MFGFGNKDKEKNENGEEKKKKKVGSFDGLKSVAGEVFKKRDYKIEKRELTNDEVQYLINEKEVNKDNIEFVCCICLLLESIPEFELNFKKLPTDVQMQFITYPICRFYNDDIQLLMQK